MSESRLQSAPGPTDELYSEVDWDWDEFWADAEESVVLRRWRAAAALFLIALLTVALVATFVTAFPAGR